MMHHRHRISILGVAIDALTLGEAIDAFRLFIARKEPSVVLAVNVDVCMKIRQDIELREIFRKADLVLVDGTPMMWAARFLGRPLPERVSGSDFVPVFCDVAAKEGYRIFLLGAGPSVAERAKDWLERRNTGLKIVGTYAPPVGFEFDERENTRIIDLIRRARPDVLFAAFGAPKQEKWLARHYRSLDVPVAMGVGSAFDYLAGRLKRAPRWMQTAGLEWTFRLGQEPRRLWRRYLLDDPPFVFLVLKERLSGPRRPGRELVAPEESVGPTEDTAAR